MRSWMPRSTLQHTRAHTRARVNEPLFKGTDARSGVVLEAGGVVLEVVRVVLKVGVVLKVVGVVLPL